MSTFDKYNRDDYTKNYKKWCYEFNLAKDEFDEKLAEINERYQDYLNCISETVIMEVFERNIEHVEKIDVCETFPESNETLACTVFLADGSVLTTTNLSVQEVNDCAYTLNAEADEEPEEDDSEYFFIENDLK